MTKRSLFGTVPVTRYLHLEGKEATPVPEDGPWREALFTVASDMGESTLKRLESDTLSYWQIYALGLGMFQYLVDNYPDDVPQDWLKYR
jgi:hypothetical protein